MTNIKDKIIKICTYHSDDGTSGYLLGEERFAKIFALIDDLERNLIKERERNVQSVIDMLEGSTDRQEIVNYVKKHLLDN